MLCIPGNGAVREGPGCLEFQQNTVSYLRHRLWSGFGTTYRTKSEAAVGGACWMQDTARRGDSAVTAAITTQMTYAGDTMILHHRTESELLNSRMSQTECKPILYVSGRETVLNMEPL